MSASAEVYISVGGTDRTKRGAFQDLIEEKLKDIGMNVADTTRFSIGHYDSGVVVECKGYSVSYEIFEPEWADGIIDDLYAIDSEADAEVYVYNLDREADASSTTRRRHLQKEQTNV
jgi:hypothetical protein